MYNPIFRITPYFLSLVDEASTLRAWIENSTLKVSWIPMLQKEAQIKSAHSSTSIEGNPLNLDQVQAIAQGANTNSPKNFEQEIRNHLISTRWIEKHAKILLSEKNILNLHKTLMKKLLPETKCGKYKDKPNFIINGKNLRIYTPPTPQKTPQLMKELISWLNAPSTSELHSIIVSAIFHHQFLSIHPFTDGNGRMARLLSAWILYQRDFDTQHIFCLDDYFALDRNKYYKKIQQARELDNNLTYWLDYIAEGIVETLKKVKLRIENLQVSSKTKMLLSPRQEEILRVLKNASSLGVSDLQKKLHLTRTRINQIITPLIKSRLIQKQGRSRATRYKINLTQT